MEVGVCSKNTPTMRCLSVCVVHYTPLLSSFTEGNVDPQNEGLEDVNN